MGLIAKRVLEEAWWLLRTIPQFAYLPWRGCQDAISRALSHRASIRAQLDSFRFKHHLAAAGQKIPAMFGGFLLSLDMSRAFDEVNRTEFFHSLKENGILADIIHVLYHIYSNTPYDFVHRGEPRSVPKCKGTC